MAKEKSKYPDVTECLKNLRYARKKFKAYFEKYKEDFEAALGKQWDEQDEITLRKAGVEPLTINKIKPTIKLLSGIERQSRSDLVGYPEGEEDGIKAEITTKLIKNVMKKAGGHAKLSSQFKSGITGGACYLEPYLDYSYDLLNGELKLKKVGATRVLVDPDSQEYDLSDAKYVVKLTYKLTKEDLLELFPNKKKQIENAEFSRFMFDGEGNLTKTVQYEDYEDHEFDDDKELEDLTQGYDLAEYYYKDKTKKFYVASQQDGTMIELDTQEEADAYATQIPGAVVIEKEIPEFRRKAFIGSTELDDDVAWTFPRWKGYPFIPYFCERDVEDGIDVELLIQGIVRGIRSLQFEYNKRRTQELRHLNASVNSGWLSPKGALDKPTMDRLQRFGSTPGFTGEFDATKAAGTLPDSWRIRPMTLSQGHAQLALENAQDIKEASGVNPDLLANSDTEQSGRAILLKQRQGLVMVQEPLDNYGETKKILGKFILSQLGELFTVETAVKVLGEAWISKQEVFKEPVFDPMGQPQLGMDGKLKTQLNPNLVGKIINEVLNDAGMGKYDITIGEGAYTETTRMANHMALMEMAKSGIPIPPDVLIKESNLPESSKSQILAAIEAQQRAMQAQPPAPKENNEPRA